MKSVIQKILCILAVLTALSGCSQSGSEKNVQLQQELTQYVAGKDATIGVAVIVDGADTVEVNGHREFPMLSVYKFPIALAMAEDYRSKELSLDHPVRIYPGDLHLDTYSPMTEKLLASSLIVTDSIIMPMRELLTYSLQQSDNNASDIIIRLAGGAQRGAE